MTREKEQHLEWLAEKYQLEAEAFHLFYQDSVVHQRALIAFAGIIAGMESDRLEYIVKHGKNAKLKPLEDRVKNLTLIYETLSGMDERNTSHKYTIEYKNREIDRLEEENKQLKQKIKDLESWNSE